MLSKNRIKFIKSLQIKKFRDENDLFLVEGEKMALEVLRNNPQIVSEIYTTKDFANKIEFSKEINEITEKELSQISSLKNPNKVLIICEKWTRKVLNNNSELTIALDSIQDPGNLGTIIRLADWFGVTNIVCSFNTADCFNPKVVQATMGSLFRVNLIYVDLLAYLNDAEKPIYGAFLEGNSIYKQELPPKGILVLGNEGNGISKEIEDLVSNKITIPRFGEAESLNVSVATGILLSEFFRGK